MARGGRRPGAGRPIGSGRYGEKTLALRVPVSRVEDIQQMIRSSYRLPFYQCAVAAGFPSPAESEMDGELDLNDLLIKHPVATFFVRVAGSSMIKAGIHHNDILVVDRSLEPLSGKIVIASINGELTVKRLYKEGPKVQLVAENDDYPPIDINEDMEVRIWGVVTNVIHSV
jgi:DNA polymerase V